METFGDKRCELNNESEMDAPAQKPLLKRVLKAVIGVFVRGAFASLFIQPDKETNDYSDYKYTPGAQPFRILITESVG